MTNDETLNEMIANSLSTFVIGSFSFLHIEITNIQRVILDKLSAGLDDVSHQDGEHLVGIDCVVVVQIDFQEFAFFRIHRRAEELLRVHFAQTFEAFDLHTAPADLDDFLMNLRN